MDGRTDGQTDSHTDNKQTGRQTDRMIPIHFPKFDFGRYANTYSYVYRLLWKVDEHAQYTLPRGRAWQNKRIFLAEMNIEHALRMLFDYPTVSTNGSIDKLMLSKVMPITKVIKGALNLG